MTKKPYIYLYDSTLRDGAQTSTVNFTLDDKISIAKMLDNIAIDYIEGGWPGANPLDDDFFSDLPQLKNSTFTDFGMTRKKDISAQNDIGLSSLINSKVKSICIVGKSWDYHLKNALNISEEDNLAMIGDSISHIVKSGKEAMFDAEHFFDGYKANPKFAISCLKQAFNNKARWIILCDTNGGTLPDEIYQIVTEVTKEIPGEYLGIHCHNDTGNAVANSIMAVKAGVRQVQGTINGLGERCGNANLITIIPNLVLKMGYETAINNDNIVNLVKISNFLDDVLNQDSNKFAPYVGKFAFAHKGGLHVSAVAKDASCYEHINPELVGNNRHIVISDQAGKSNIISKLKEIDIDSKNLSNQQVTELVSKVKDLEAKGYAFDIADASFELLVKKTIAAIPNFFELISFRVLNERRFDKNGKFKTIAEATIKIKINNKIIMSVAEGNGPVNALDKSLRKALLKNYPILKNVKLTDYKVRILSTAKNDKKHQGTKAVTRVQIQSGDNNGNSWNTIGVSENIIDASFYAIYDSVIYKLSKEIKLKINS